jgi:L-amino acid N-acyltransferase YncA
MTIQFRSMTAEDWPTVKAIYRAGIDTGNATFESDPPEWESFDTGKLHTGRLVAVDHDNTAIGWVAASPVSARDVYRGVVEHSVYVSGAAAGKGVGLRLVQAFIVEADLAGIWMIQSSIFPENTASLAVHQRAGFRTVGHRERIARMTYGPYAGQWRDTVLVERRSA